MSNVYKRLQSAKVALQGIELKESGKNAFAGYSYMELGDFLPQINNLCLEHGICGVVSFGEVATLTIVNIDKPEEKIVFESPMSTAELKGCHPVQNLGAVQSYTRRYLWIAAFDIVEHDALDSTNGKTDGKKEDKKPQPAQQNGTGEQKPATTDAEYQERIKNKLQELYGDDNFAKKSSLMKLAEYTDKQSGEVKQGRYDYHKMTGDPLKWLCYKVEKLTVSREPGDEG